MIGGIISGILIGLVAFCVGVGMIAAWPITLVVLLAYFMGVFG